MEEEFIVEEIITKRYQNGKLEYFVKWLNYGDEENTWEPRKNLADDVIEKFDKLQTREQEVASQSPVRYFLPKFEKMKTRNSGTVRKSKGRSSTATSCSSTRTLEAEKSEPKTRTVKMTADKRAVVPRHEKKATDANSRARTVKPSDLVDPTESYDGRIPSEILGCCEHEDEVWYLVNWEGPEQQINLVPWQWLSQNFPLLVIVYLQQHLVWKSVDEASPLAHSNAESRRLKHSSPEFDDFVSFE
ncbi:Heterochromatin protein 1 [Halotydeus destructor]|nr:Heterochromatin protein 1 [Halotydeus destructor]